MSRTFELPFGQRALRLSLPGTAEVEVLVPSAAGAEEDEASIVTRALRKPIGSRPLREVVNRGRTAVVITSDNTRPCPSPQLLPPILGELQSGGISADETTVVVALGLHRPLSNTELRELVGPEVYDSVEVVNHDPANVVRVGWTSAGTPVDLFRPVVDADVRVGLGNIEFHYFAGYSGGAKSILPGCAGEQTVSANHALMVEPGARVGALENNPVRADLEEGAALVGLDFILNAVVDSNHRLVAAVAGDATQAHRRGCGILAGRDAVPIYRKTDIVVVSSGGTPFDLNLYQAQKALENAGAVVRDGGVVIWVAECPEGYGNPTFERWMREAETPEQVMDRIARRFVLGGHKAAAIASVQMRAEVCLVSAMGARLQDACGIVGFSNLDDALRTALEKVGAHPSVAVIPHGGSTFPIPDEAADAA